MVALTFSDVLIKPKHSRIRSRKDVSLNTSFGHFELALPVFSANMKSITGVKMAVEMYNNGAMGMLHRFCSIEEAVDDFKEVATLASDLQHPCGVSIGIHDNDKERFDKLYEAGAKIFCIDVAHGDHASVQDMLKWINQKKLSDVYIIAGNVATGDGAYNLADWGANCVKIGIGPGHACMTRKFTGVGVPQLYALEDVDTVFKQQGISNVQKIADGGIEAVGDISKALKYVDGVMLGKFLSGTAETPGPVFQNQQGSFYKVYAGSASGENKFSNGQTTDFVEGVAMEVPFRGKVYYILKSILEGVQSACSYVGANNLKEFKDLCEFIQISGGGKTESKI